MLINFITKKPQGLHDLFNYTHNNIKSYDVSSNLIMVEGSWSVVDPVYNKENDFRQLYHNKNIFLKNATLHSTLNNNFTNFDAKSRNCLVRSTGDGLCEYDSIYSFKKDLLSDPINHDYIKYNIYVFETLNNYLICEFGLINDHINSVENINPIITVDDIN